jgi:hypothetical protein
MWITVTETDFREVLTGPEITAIQTAATQAGQTDPLPNAMNDAIQFVRGKVAGCLQNVLGDQTLGYKIPQELRRVTLILGAYYGCDRVPAGVMNADRKKEYDGAMRTLDQIASCEMRIEQPLAVTQQVISGPYTSLVTSSEARAGREQMRGL